MKEVMLRPLVCLFVIAIALCSLSQESPVSTAVPRWVTFNGTISMPPGTTQTIVKGVTFAIYKDQHGGAPLWLETQNVRPNAAGAYSVLLGSTKSGGLPVDLFASGEARWLGVQVQGQAEQSRVLMVAVPYALKAADSETVGGLPPSAFVLAMPSDVSSAGSNSSVSGGSGEILPPVGGGGTTNYVPLWTSSTNLGNSNIYQNSSKFIGIGTTSPASTLDVNGPEYVRGQLFLPAAGTATPTQGFNSRVLNLTASSYNSNTHSAENHSLQWVAEPLGNNTPSPSATLHLRFFSTGAAQETGYSIGSNGLVTFAPGQTFPGAGTITGVTAGTDLTGGGTSGKVTLNLDTTKVPQLNVANTFNANQTINGTETINGPGGFNVPPALTVNNTSYDGPAAAQITGGDFGLSVGAEGTGISAGGGNVGVEATSDSTGVSGHGGSNGLYGELDHLTGTGAAGVFGKGAPSSAPVMTFGVEGMAISTLGIGTSGDAISTSTTGGSLVGNSPFGVWGDTGVTGTTTAGVLATADDALALWATNNSLNPTAYFENQSSSPSSAVALQAGGMSGTCSIYGNGNLGCTGTKSAVVPLPNDRKVALYAVESPENWFEDFGSGQLSSGSVHVALEPAFSNTINTAEYYVFITPRGDSEGLYVTDATPSGFDVRESHGGSSNIFFDYRIVAHRKGYENVRLADMTEHFQTPPSKVRNNPLQFKPPAVKSTKIARMPRTRKGRVQPR